MEQLADNVWVLRYPKRLLGVKIGRVVTVIRLNSGRLIIHSTAPFSPSDVGQISTFGEPAWLLDVSRFHDSFAKQGRKAFPAIDYLVPDGFPKAKALNSRTLDAVPAEWSGEVRVRKIDGMPSVQEHVLLHVASRTLIVADLLFNFGESASRLTKFIARHLLRLRSFSGMSPVFRSMIRDKAAFHRSMAEVLAWDFDRVIVGHGDIVETGGKQRLADLVSGV